VRCAPGSASRNGASGPRSKRTPGLFGSHARTLCAPPALRRESTVNAETLRTFIGSPRSSRWKRLCEAAGVDYRRAGRKPRRLTYGECRRVMEVWFRELGEFRAKRFRT
jgi:hypothetical protein